MFCPRCKCEYREGFTTCSDCNISLVDALPTETNSKHPKREIEYTDYEFITTTFGFTEVAQIKSILDSEGIIYYIQGEDIGSALGLQPRILVKKEQVAESKQLLKDFNLL